MLHFFDCFCKWLFNQTSESVSGITADEMALPWPTEDCVCPQTHHSFLPLFYCSSLPLMSFFWFHYFLFLSYSPIPVFLLVVSFVLLSHITSITFLFYLHLTWDWETFLTFSDVSLKWVLTKLTLYNESQWVPFVTASQPPSSVICTVCKALKISLLPARENSFRWKSLLCAFLHWHTERGLWPFFLILLFCVIGEAVMEGVVNYSTFCCTFFFLSQERFLNKSWQHI